MNDLSVIISTHNRVKSLVRTLESIKNLAAEIIVIDSSSNDDTNDIAKKYTKHVYIYPNNLQLNINKNHGIQKATKSWLLYLDDDEVVSDQLASEIKKVIVINSNEAGFWIPRKNIIFGKWIQHGIWWPDKQLRLFRKGTGNFPAKHVHESLQIVGQTGSLVNALVHYNYESIEQYLDKMQRIYIDNEVKKMQASGYVLDWRDAIRFPLSDFLKLYFAQHGWKDGVHGLVLAIMQSFYSFLVFAKLWQDDQFREVNIPLESIDEQFVRTKKEGSYWLMTTKIQTAKNIVEKNYFKLIRKLFA